TRPTLASRTAISVETRHGGRDSNSQPLVLETRALPIELPPYAAPRRRIRRPSASCQWSSRLAVRRVLPAPWAELRKLDPVGIVLPVLRRRVRARPAGRARQRDDRAVVFGHLCRPIHSRIFVATPAPTVLPPSRMANRRPSSRAIGVMSVTSRLVLSPGMTISVPSLSLASPVTSVVRM